MSVYTPKIPKPVRDWAYGVGAIVGVGVGPSLAAFGYPEAGVAAGAMAGAANVLAWGYRPSKAPEGWTGDPTTDG